MISSGALNLVDITNSPNYIIQDKPTTLKCLFSGWPLPDTVHWYKDDELISNGTGDIYHSLQKKDETLHSTLHLPPGREEHEGYYKCSARNSIPGWSSSKSEVIQIIHKCKLLWSLRPLKYSYICCCSEDLFCGECLVLLLNFSQLA